MILHWYIYVEKVLQHNHLQKDGETTRKISSMAIICPIINRLLIFKIGYTIRRRVSCENREQLERKEFEIACNT